MNFSFWPSLWFGLLGRLLMWYCRRSLLHHHFFPYKNGLSQSKDRPWRAGIAEELASEAYRAIGGIARNGIANRASGTLGEERGARI